MKGLLLSGVAVILFLTSLVGLGGKRATEDFSTEFRSGTPFAEIKAVSLPFGRHVIIPEQLTLNDHHPSDPEKNSKTLLSTVSGPDLFNNLYPIQQAKAGGRIGLPALMFILFRNLRL